MNKHFQRGHGVYKCGVCGRQTRGSSDSTNSRLCSQCYDIAGLDNMFNDDGTIPSASERAELEAMLQHIVDHGGDAEAVRAENRYAFPVLSDLIRA